MKLTLGLQVFLTTTISALLSHVKTINNSLLADKLLRGLVSSFFHWLILISFSLSLLTNYFYGKIYSWSVGHFLVSIFIDWKNKYQNHNLTFKIISLIFLLCSMNESFWRIRHFIGFYFLFKQKQIYGLNWCILFQKKFIKPIGFCNKKNVTKKQKFLIWHAWYDIKKLSCARKC